MNAQNASDQEQALDNSNYLDYLAETAAPQQEQEAAAPQEAKEQNPVNNSAEAQTSAPKPTTKKKYVLEAISKPEEKKEQPKENKPSPAPQSDMAPELTVNLAKVEWGKDDIMHL